MPEHILEILGVSVIMILGSLQFIKMAINRFAPVKTSKAVVADKTVIEHFSKYTGSGMAKEYVIVFFHRGQEKVLYRFPVFLRWLSPPGRGRTEISGKQNYFL